MSTGMQIAKAGWLYRQSSVLHRWKKNWFVLYQDGILRYFESQESHRAEEVYVMRTCCTQIKTGAEVTPVEPPEGATGGKGCVFEVHMREGGHLLLFAESVDDMKAWQCALEQARTMQAPPAPPGYTPAVQHFPPANAYPGYCAYPSAYPSGHHSSYAYGYSGGYPGQVISTPTAGSQVMQSADGQVTLINPGGQVVYVDSDYDYPYRRRRRYGYGAGTGFLAGAMIGSSMMYPWYF